VSPLFLAARLHAHLIFSLARWTCVILHARAALIAAYFATIRRCRRVGEDRSAANKQHDSKTQDAHASIPFSTATAMRHWDTQFRVQEIRIGGEGLSGSVHAQISSTGRVMRSALTEVSRGDCNFPCANF
jgi:hypothetical protein